jgi:transcriptional regulator with XRE-family HTH domain
MTFTSRFAENLRHSRKLARLSQEQLSVRASLHRTAVVELEGGQRTPGIDTLVKLAGALQVRPEVLLDGLEWLPGEMNPGKFK